MTVDKVTAYRMLYWEKNELQIIQSDSGVPEVIQEEIDKREKQLAAIAKQLGYHPEP